MIKYKCPNCKRETLKDKKQVMVLCGCGVEMEILNKCPICNKEYYADVDSTYCSYECFNKSKLKGGLKNNGINRS